MDRNSSEIPTLIFGTTVTVLGAVRAFGRRGSPVWTHTDPDDPVTLSRYYRPMPLPQGFDPKASTVDRLPAILRALPFETAFLLPCSDLWTEAATVLPDDLRARFPSSIAPRDSIATLTDKGKLAALMTELGLPHPRSYVVDSEADLAVVDDRVFESGFLKPKASPDFMQIFKVKGFFVHSRAEAIAQLRKVKAAGFDVILQEYIPGPPTAHYFIDGFMDSSSVVRARFARQRLRMHPPDFGNSSYMVSVDIDEVRPAMEALEILLTRLKYRGIFSAEFKRDPRDGKFNLIEVNARPWWYVGFAESCGVKVCAMAYADALGRPLPTLSPYPVGKTCVYPKMDLLEYRWHRRNRPDEPRASLPTRLATWLFALKPTFAWDDPQPAINGSVAIAREYFHNRRRVT